VLKTNKYIDLSLLKTGCAVRRPRIESNGNYDPAVWPTGWPYYSFLYDYNPYLGVLTSSGAPGSMWGHEVAPIRLSRIVSPDHKITVGDYGQIDASGLGYVRYFDSVVAENDGGRAFYCHDFRCNFSFVDGHSEAKAWTEMGTSGINGNNSKYWLWPESNQNTPF